MNKQTLVSSLTLLATATATTGCVEEGTPRVPGVVRNGTETAGTGGATARELTRAESVIHDAVGALVGGEIVDQSGAEDVIDAELIANLLPNAGELEITDSSPITEKNGLTIECVRAESADSAEEFLGTDNVKVKVLACLGKGDGVSNTGVVVVNHVDGSNQTVSLLGFVPGELGVITITGEQVTDSYTPPRGEAISETISTPDAQETLEVATEEILEEIAR